MSRVKSILCFGDSNTYGAIPTLSRVGRHRYATERRWPGVLRKSLGVGWEVIEEGHPSRTTVHDDPIEGANKNGLRALPVCLESHMPLDLVILMLGTNDLKHRFSVTANDIGDSIEVLIRAVQRSEAGPAGVPPAVIVIAPPPMQEIDWLGEMFRGGMAKSAHLPLLVGEAARRTGAGFLNAAEFLESSAVDGVHFDSDAHQILGAKVRDMVLDLVG